MLEAIIGSKTREQILVYPAGRQEGYAREIARYYGKSISPVQNQLERLENGNVLAGKMAGRTRIYTFNPRYPFRKNYWNYYKKQFCSCRKRKKKD